MNGLLKARWSWRLYQGLLFSLLLAAWGSFNFFLLNRLSFKLWFREVISAWHTAGSTLSYRGKLIISICMLILSCIKLSLAFFFLFLKLLKHLLIKRNLSFLHITILAISMLDASEVFNLIIFFLLVKLIFLFLN